MNEDNILDHQNDIPVEPLPVKEEISFSKLDVVVSIISLVLGFLFIRFAVCNITGFITTIVFDLIATLGIFYVKKSGYKISKKNLINIIVIYLFSLVYSITANGFIKFLDSVFLILQVTYTMYRLCDDSSKSPRFYYYAQMKSLFSYTFANFDKCPKAIIKTVFKGNHGGNLRWIILGLIVATPITFIVATLLVSADEGIEKILDNFNTWFMNNLNVTLLLQILFGFLIGCNIFSMMYSNIYKKNFSPYNDTTYEIKFNNWRVCPSIMIYSALTPMCMLYILYVVSQIGYFTGAFNGNLYEGYTYSEYARRGFFELTAISCINLGVIFLANLLCKRLGNSYYDKKPLALKIYNLIFSMFTIFIIATAMSKMLLYIGEYGLTRLRVYTSWFMILLALIFIIMIVSEFKEFNVSSIFKIAFTIMFGILCFCRVDRVIANTNISLYERNQIEHLNIDDLQYLLSYDAYAPILEYDYNHNNSIENSSLEEQYLNIPKYEKYNISTIEFIKTYEKYYK